MNEHKPTCKEVMSHICDNLGEELDSPKCIEIKAHLETCENCRHYFKSVETTIQFYKKYDELSSRFILTVDARSALRLVELGEVDSGIVYYSDAVTSKRVRIISEVPEESHQPIVYQAVIINEQSPIVSSFFKFLYSEENRKVWNAHGFKNGTTPRQNTDI